MPGFVVRAKIAGLALLAFSAPAFAQDVDRITGTAAPGGGFRAPEGVKQVAPGALIFASFDRNSDGKITQQEIEAGAAIAFATADRNQDGVITGFEQTDWANAMGSASDLIANAMTFDIDLDRSVTNAEFTTGLKRIASQIRAEGDLTFADLLLPLSSRREEASAGFDLGLGTIKGRGSPPGGGRN